MYSCWPNVEEIGDYAQLDEIELQRAAAASVHTGLSIFKVPLFFGDFYVGATAFGVSTLFFPETEDYDISSRLSYYQLAFSSSGKKMAIGAGIELMGYSCGEVTTFETPVDLSYLTHFQQDVLHAARKIPFGQIRTPSELAIMAGHPGKGGAVSRVIRHNPLPIIVPCHRVVAANGTLGNYCDDQEWKQYLLHHEGIDIALPMA